MSAAPHLVHNHTQAFFGWLASKAEVLEEIEQQLIDFNKRLHEHSRQHCDPLIRFEVTFNVKTKDEEECFEFAVERKERLNYSENDASRIIISSYVLPIELCRAPDAKGHSARVSHTLDKPLDVAGTHAKVLSGNLETFPDRPRRGKWGEPAVSSTKHISEPTYTYAGKGWAALVFHVATWVTSALHVTRKILPVAAQTHKLIEKYRTGTIRLEYHGRKVVFPFSDALTEHAKSMMDNWLVGTAINKARLHSFGASAANPYLVEGNRDHIVDIIAG